MDRHPPQQIVAIDALRFGCSALVTAFHFLTILPLADSSPVRLFDPAILLPSGGASATWFGWVGVELFFVISGFVIALSAGGSDRATFLRRRVLRLAPVAWVCATLTALTLLVALPPDEILPRWTVSVLFVPTPEQIDGPYWTLRVELAFYLLVALALRGTDNRARIAGVGWGLAAWSALYWAAMLIAGTATQDALDAPLPTLLLLPHGAFFALGIALWTIRDRGASPARLSLAMVALAACLTEIVVHARTMAAVPVIDARPALPLLVFTAGIVAIAAAGLLQRPLLATVGAPRLRTIGRMTYPLYLLNLTIGAALTAGLVALGLPPYAALALAAGLVLLSAFVIAERIEPPVRAWFARRIDGLSSRRGSRRDTLPNAFPPAG